MKNNDKIKQMYERIDTPQYDVKDSVLNEINKQKTLPRINRKVLLVAVMVIILLIGMAGVAGAFDHMLMITSPSAEPDYSDEAPAPTPTATPVPSEGTNLSYVSNIDKLFYEFIDPIAYGEYREAHVFYETADENGCTGYGTESISPVETTDFSFIKGIITGSKTPLPFPSSIPEGYLLEEGGIDFYLVEEMKDMQPDNTWIEDGITFSVYQLPDGFEKNILRYTLRFVDQNENRLSIFLELTGSKSGMGDVRTDDDRTAEYVEVEGFEDAVLIHNEEEGHLYEYVLALYNPIEPVNISEFSWMVHAAETGNHEEDSDYMFTYDSIIMRISAGNLTENELIKFAEGLR